MKPAGLLLVTRRYWPMPGGWEKVWTRLLGELARRGRNAIVLTPRQQTDWPAETIHNGVRIVRLPPPARGGWGLAKNGAAFINPSNSSITMAPPRSNAARYALSDPAKLPVCDIAAAAPSVPVAILLISSGLPLRRAICAASSRRYGWFKPSNAQAIAWHAGSSAR